MFHFLTTISNTAAQKFNPQVEKNAVLPRHQIMDISGVKQSKCLSREYGFEQACIRYSKNCNVIYHNAF